MSKEQRLNELADYINGTCNNLESGLEAHFPDITEEEANEHLDSCDICICDVCGWWCDDWSEAGMICTECFESGEEHDAMMQEDDEETMNEE